jgi:hypothetical protein
MQTQNVSKIELQATAENRKPAAASRAVSKRYGCRHRHVQFAHSSVFAAQWTSFWFHCFWLTALNKVPSLSVRKALVLNGAVVSCAITEQKLKRIIGSKQPSQQGGRILVLIEQ